MKRNRRSFLKAALGCATALVVPGVLPSVTPKPKLELLRPTARENIVSWYKPGIWAMPKGSAKAIEGTIIVHETADVVYLKMMVDGSWNDVASSKRFLER